MYAGLKMVDPYGSHITYTVAAFFSHVSVAGKSHMHVVTFRLQGFPLALFGEHHCVTAACANTALAMKCCICSRVKWTVLGVFAMIDTHTHTHTHTHTYTMAASIDSVPVFGRNGVHATSL